MGSACSPSDYLSTCSESAIESYELSRLNRAANLRKELRQLVDEWIDCEVEARLARWTLESRRNGDRAELTPPEELPVAELPRQLALPLNRSARGAERNAIPRRSASQRGLSLRIPFAPDDKSPAPSRPRAAVRSSNTNDSAQVSPTSHALRRDRVPLRLQCEDTLRDRTLRLLVFDLSAVRSCRQLRDRAAE